MTKLQNILLLTLIGLSTLLPAQSGNASIFGQVTDPSGASVPKAEVMATNEATQAIFKASSNDQGLFTFAALPIGTYKVLVTASGFKKAERAGITLQVADRISLNIGLDVGAATEVISVTSEVPLLRTEDSQTGEVINSTMITNLPQLNRNPLELLRLAGNVQGGGGVANEGSDTRINGGRTQGVDYLVDGISQSMGVGRGVSSTTPTMEAVAEFKVITNGISAEYGRMSGGAVELVTKSGTNNYHGQLFAYLKNRAFNANSWNNNRLGAIEPLFQEHTTGGAIGGPVSIPKLYDGKNKTFFFFNFQNYFFNQAGSAQTRTVPTAAMRGGDFSQVFTRGGNGERVPAQLFDNNGEVNVATTERLTPFPNNIIPASRLDSISRALVSLMPQPNRTPDSGTSYLNNFVGLNTTKSRRYDYALRLDHNFSERTRFFGRWTTYNTEDRPNSRFAGPLQAVNATDVNQPIALTMNVDHIVSPNSTLNVRVGLIHNPLVGGQQLADGVGSQIPFGAATRALLGTSQLPWIGTTVGDITSGGNAFQTAQTSYNASVSMTKIVSRHNLKYGYEHRRFYDNRNNGGSGNFVFQQNPVARFARDDSWNPQDNANVYGAVMLGLFDKRELLGATTRAVNFNYNAAYLQDDFRVNNKLTLNLGIRWDMETPATERNDRLYFWDSEAPAPFTMTPGYNFQNAVRAAGLNPANLPTPRWVNGFLPGALQIANTQGFSSRTGTKYFPWQFAPRIGLAYQMTSKSVLRASFGQMYNSTAGDPNGIAAGGDGITLGDGVPNAWHVSSDPRYYRFFQTLSRPFEPAELVAYERTAAVANRQATGGDPGPAGFDRNARMPRELLWSLGMQHQLTNKLLFEVNYSANRGVGLLGKDLISRLPRQAFTPANGAALLTPVQSPVREEIRYPSTPGLAFLLYDYPYFGPAVVRGVNYGRSNYQSMNFRLERRLTQNTAFLVNYTLGWMSDNVGGPSAGNGIAGGGTGGRVTQSIDDPRQNYGVSSLDERHRLSLYYQYNLPFGKGRRYLGSPTSAGSRFLDGVIGGWEFAGISLWRSGRPIIIPHTNVNNNVRVEATYPTLTGALDNGSFAGNWGAFISPDSPSGVSRFTRSAITEAAPFTAGNVNLVDSIRHPSRLSHDMSFMKRFNIFPGAESRFLQFRAEANNVFNIRGMGDYISDPRDANFGLIDGARGLYNTERRIQFSARIIF
jgi:hypothetical protein